MKWLVGGGMWLVVCEGENCYLCLVQKKEVSSRQVFWILLGFEPQFKKVETFM